MALIKCGECGKEVSDKANNCPNCGYPIVSEDNQCKDTSDILDKSSIRKIPIVPLIILSGLILLLLFGVYKGFIQPKNNYTKAVALLNDGRYDEASVLLNKINDYKDTDAILSEIKFESYAYMVINDLKLTLKNPDSLHIRNAMFYSSIGEQENKASVELMSFINLVGNSDSPACVLEYSAQNGFGGNSVEYALGYFSKEKNAYTLLGVTNTLDESQFNAKTEDDIYDLLTTQIINLFVKANDVAGNVNLDRVKTVVKNNSYSLNN